MDNERSTVTCLFRLNLKLLELLNEIMAQVNLQYKAITVLRLHFSLIRDGGRMKCGCVFVFVLLVKDLS